MAPPGPSYPITAINGYLNTTDAQENDPISYINEDDRGPYRGNKQIPY